MKNERSDKRIFLLFYLEIYCNDTERFLGSVMDISSNGMRLCCKHPRDIDKTLNCRMILPVPPMEYEEIVFETKVVWCEKAFNPNFYDIGTHFHNLSIEQQRIINRLIDITIYDHCWIDHSQCFPMEY